MGDFRFAGCEQREVCRGDLDPIALLGCQAFDLDGGCHVGINASAPEKKTATERGGR